MSRDFKVRPTLNGINLATYDNIEIPLVTFSKQGAITVAAGVLIVPVRGAWTITAIVSHISTVPTGASVIMDINKNGTTIFTTQANRPTIAISGTDNVRTNMDITALADTDQLAMDIDQIGSTIAGSNLTCTVWGKRA